MGYHRSGFTDIVGVDIVHQKRYPFEFVQGDALEYLAEHGHEYDGIHASPPCQAFVMLAKHRPNPKDHKDWLSPTLDLVEKMAIPYVVENVMTSPLRATVILCGSHFGLTVQKHRKFKTSFILPQPACDHNWPTADGKPVGVYGGSFKKSNADGKPKWIGGRRAESVAEARQAMGIGWMTGKEISEAIPPAYTEWIGRHLLQYLETKHVLPDNPHGPIAEGTTE